MSEIKNIRINNFELKLADSDDPVASKVSWSPAKPGGANFKAHHMDAVDNKLIVRRSGKAKAFASIFIVPGFGAVLIGAPWAFIAGNFLLGIFAIVWGGLFGGMGWFLFQEKQFVFDKQSGVYYRGKAFVHNAAARSKDQGSKNQGKLSRIHAIQLLSERITSSGDEGSSNYLSYELNLVFENAERINVMDGGDSEYVEDSAVRLAAYLNVPVWKAQY